MKNNCNYPNFIGVGSQRAGTTWLYNCLREHPEIYLPDKKELHFFDLNYQADLSHYLEHFALSDNHRYKAVGEITPSYYQYPQALERIAQFNPDIRIIYIVRNPIERAYSQYKLFSANHFKDKSFSQVIRGNERIIDLGLQAKHLERIYRLFPEQNVLVMLYDDLCTNPERFIKKAYDFLQVDNSFKPQSLTKRINRVVFPRLQNTLKALKMTWLITAVKNSSLAEPIKNLARPKDKTKLQKNDLIYLQEKFSKDILSLENKLNIDLSHWRIKC